MPEPNTKPTDRPSWQREPRSTYTRAEHQPSDDAPPNGQPRLWQWLAQLRNKGIPPAA